MKKISNVITLILLFLITGINSNAQDNSRAMLKQVLKENQEAVNAIAMYPRETRKIIFEASGYPEVIVKLNAMQKNTQDAFEKLISSFSKDEQEKLWNMTRYDNLISDLVSDHRKSETEINGILANYPDEIHKTALEEGIKNYDLLIQIDNMNKSYNSDFETMISTYPPDDINAFREIIKLPEVLQILFNHMQYTVVIGDYYKKNPERVLHKTDSLNQALTQKTTQEAEDWKQSINSDPQAQQEYTEAAQEYAQENGYQPEEYNTPLTPDVTNYNTTSYNWWFGYPSWYPYDYWNPYPYWYDWGFYYGPNRQIVFFGMPSAYFMNWYFYNPKYCSKYPELSNHYYHYYNSHISSKNHNTISYSVNNWKNNNRSIVTDDWDKDNTNRTKRFKEFGQMEINRNKYNTKHPKKQIQQSEYVQKKQNKYPLLSADVSKNQSFEKNNKLKVVQENISQPSKTPTFAIPDRYKASENVRINNSNNINNNAQKQNANRQQQSVFSNPQNKNTNQVKQTENFNQIRNAQQYHENTWKQIEPQSQPQRQQTQPQQQQPQRQQQQQPQRQQTQPQQQQPQRQQQNYTPAPRQQEQPARQDVQSSPGGRKK